MTRKVEETTPLTQPERGLELELLAGSDGETQESYRESPPTLKLHLENYFSLAGSVVEPEFFGTESTDSEHKSFRGKNVKNVLLFSCLIIPVQCKPSLDIPDDIVIQEHSLQLNETQEEKVGNEEEEIEQL